MKVSDPIIFGHVVRAFLPEVFERYGADLGGGGPLAQQRARRHPRRPLGPAQRRRDQGGHRQGHRRRSAPGDGELRQGHHQPPRPERRHRRRLDAGDDPHLRPHVGPRRRGARHPRRHPRQLVRRHLPGRPRRLPRERRVRPDDDGLGPQRRSHGPEGRGVRQPRQDLRDRRRGSGRGGRRRRRGAHRPRRRAGRHLARLPDQGRPDPRLGQAGGHARPRLADPGGVLARRAPRPRPQPHRQGRDLPRRPRHRRASTCGSCPPSRRRGSPSSGSAAARTPSR